MSAAATAPLTTTAPRWHGPRLDGDAREVLDLLDEVAHDRAVVLADDQQVVEAVRGTLVELGVWAIGVPEEIGGPGADAATTLVVLERLGRFWPALGWASAQVQAGIPALAAGSAGTRALADDLHAGSEAVVVVEATGAHADLVVEGSTVRGSIARVDGAHTAPHVLLLDGADAVLLRSEGLTFTAVGTTGLDGSMTRSVDVDVTDAERITGTAGLVRATLLRHAVALAAGIGGAAADTAAAYASERHQFGGPLTRLPTVHASLASQVAHVRIALAALVGADGPATLAPLLRTTCDQMIDVAGAALQVHGGYGYLTEYPAERHVRDAVSFRAATAALTSSFQEPS